MPASHKRFLEALSSLSNIRPFVNSPQVDSSLKEAYNAAVLALTSFRDAHIQMVSRYIIVPARKQIPPDLKVKSGDTINLATASAQAKGSSETNSMGLSGTGGTSLIPFLKHTRDTTKSATC